MAFIIKNLEVSLGSIKEKNLNLEKRYKWPEGQISNKIGIKQRHISNASQNTTTLAKTAVKKILKKNNLSKVKFIISVTNTPTRVFPSLAHEISSLINKMRSCVSPDNTGGLSMSSNQVDSLSINLSVSG